MFRLKIYSDDWDSKTITQSNSIDSESLLDSVIVFESTLDSVCFRICFV
ncbi:hypothetical protein [uncultured Helicobacter sp.]